MLFACSARGNIHPPFNGSPILTTTRRHIYFINPKIIHSYFNFKGPFMDIVSVFR